MDESRESVPTTEGYLVVDADGIRIEADLDQFLKGQTAMWDDGDAADRLLLLYKYLFPLVLFWIGAVVYEPAVFGTSLLAGLIVLAGVGVLAWNVRLTDVEIDHDWVEAVDLDLDGRTVDLEYTDYRPRRWATPDQSGYRTKLRFPSDDAAERARAVLAESPLADRLEVTEADDETVETDHRVEVEDGVLFCESCGTQVSPADERCPSCNYGLWPETTAEPPDGSDPDIDRPKTMDVDYGVEVKAGVLLCEACGTQVSPTDAWCPACDHRIWTPEDAADEDDSADEDDEQRETETIYRVETEKGVPFCENCGERVSPTDDACRACDYLLRVERVVVTEDE